MNSRFDRFMALAVIGAAIGAALCWLFNLRKLAPVAILLSIAALCLIANMLDDAAREKADAAERATKSRKEP